MSFLKIIILAIIQGVAELLPVSSSAHVIVAEKLMGLDPSSPEMTFLLVMLHTGTMVAVLIYFWPRWRHLSANFFKMLIVATAATGVLGLALKKLIERFVFRGVPHAEVEHLFKNLTLMSAALFAIGLLIIYSGLKNTTEANEPLSTKKSLWIGIVQGLCLPLRGFSRSGATISTGLCLGISRELAEKFSFALAVLLTPPVIYLEVHRLLKANLVPLEHDPHLRFFILQGLGGMLLSCLAGLLALKWLSSWLEKGKWQYFGYYCLFASGVVFTLSRLNF